MEKRKFGLGVALLTLTYCPIGLLADGTNQYYEGPPDKSVETFQKWSAEFNSWASCWIVYIYKKYDPDNTSYLISGGCKFCRLEFFTLRPRGNTMGCNHFYSTTSECLVNFINALLYSSTFSVNGPWPLSVWSGERQMDRRQVSILHELVIVFR